jgi:hypothetical protein
MMVVAGSLLFHSNVLNIFGHCLRHCRVILKLTKADIAALHDMGLAWVYTSLKILGLWV